MMAGDDATVLDADVDDAQAAYVVAIRDRFDELHQAAALMTGALALVTAGSRALGEAQAAVDFARDLHAAALDGVRAARVPAQARHCHLHLIRAARLLTPALAVAPRLFVRADDDDIDLVLAALRSAWDELRDGARLLPGCGIVSLGQGCCGCAAGDRPPVLACS